ncbi:purine and other phosphorylase-like protein, family 1 [Dyella telluris]|uniref:Purine and other phosphorylase-like protein, family 1 n=1 Tax=Dyella telluris TaxID=2763498 RepID=A0A7G8Q319_9GAMM|nr:purine and other phosphorylase-like protein, family 1 [Dyella telluris]QNK01177.1 purine and other phosphorylase-like protein, family 1 [Dyella telluris]
MPGTVGIVTALAAEAHALTPRSLRVREATRLDAGSSIYLSGMGQEAARLGALALIEAGAQALVSFGVAGGLAPGLRSGTLLCPACVLDERSHDYQPDPSWRAALLQRLAATNLPLMAQGSLLSLPVPLLTATEKGAMRERHQSLAVDMESAAIARVADEYRIPFVVLRAVVDERDDHVPAALQAGIDAWGRPLAARMLLALLRRPQLLAELPGLAARMGNATRTLRATAKAVGASWGRDAAPPC